MSAAVAAAGLLPDPPYLFIPFFAVLGGLVRSTWRWLAEHEPDLPRAWAEGNLIGAAVGAVLLSILLAAGVH